MDDRHAIDSGNYSVSNSNSANMDDVLEIGKAERAMWLMKCPPVVSRCFQTPLDDCSRRTAKIGLSIDLLQCVDDDDSSSPEFTMELAGTDSRNVPKCFSMDMSKDLVPMAVFSESLQGKKSAEGKILNKFDMKPTNENFENYGKLCRERTSKCMNKSRQIQVIGNDNGAHMRPMPGMFGFLASVPNDKKKMSNKGSELKRTRRDRGEVEEIIFKLFERQPNWTLRNLIQETDQPEQFLKDILKDLCMYKNKGTFQGSYELKPEYRKSSEELTSKQIP